MYSQLYKSARLVFNYLLLLGLNQEDEHRYMYTYTSITSFLCLICMYMYLYVRYSCTKKYSLNNKASCFIGSNKPIKVQIIIRINNIHIQTIEAHIQFRLTMKMLG